MKHCVPMTTLAFGGCTFVDNGGQQNPQTLTDPHEHCHYMAGIFRIQHKTLNNHQHWWFHKISGVCKNDKCIKMIPLLHIKHWNSSQILQDINSLLIKQAARSL